MMNAIVHGHKEVVRIFLDKNYAIDTEVKQGKMLFEWAIELGHISLIKVFTNYVYRLAIILLINVSYIYLLCKLVSTSN